MVEVKQLGERMSFPRSIHEKSVTMIFCRRHCRPHSISLFHPNLALSSQSRYPPLFSGAREVGLGSQLSTDSSPSFFCLVAHPADSCNQLVSAAQIISFSSLRVSFRGQWAAKRPHHVIDPIGGAVDRGGQSVSRTSGWPLSVTERGKRRKLSVHQCVQDCLQHQPMTQSF